MSKVEGRSFSSNTAKLLKQLDTLKGMQEGKVKPVMVHLAMINYCNLDCSFCCFGERTFKEKLTKEQVFSALDQFSGLGVNAVEYTGGGEPMTHKNIAEIVDHADTLGYHQGMCTNGTLFHRDVDYSKFDWIRVGLYEVAWGNPDRIDIEKVINKTKISGAHVYEGGKPEELKRIIEFANEYQIPTRLAADCIKPPSEVIEELDEMNAFLKDNPSDYVFVSDFNVKMDRERDNCYMHMIKPFVFPDGNVYVCPSAELSPENNKNVNEEFKVCSIEDITKVYSQGVTTRMHGCKFCKYAAQNELIHEVLRPTTNNEFA